MAWLGGNMRLLKNIFLSFICVSILTPNVLCMIQTNLQFPYNFNNGTNACWMVSYLQCLYRLDSFRELMSQLPEVSGGESTPHKFARLVNEVLASMPLQRLFPQDFYNFLFEETLKNYFKTNIKKDKYKKASKDLGDEWIRESLGANEPFIKLKDLPAEQKLHKTSLIKELFGRINNYNRVRNIEEMLLKILNNIFSKDKVKQTFERSIYNLFINFSKHNPIPNPPLSVPTLQAIFDKLDTHAKIQRIDISLEDDRDYGGIDEAGIIACLRNIPEFLISQNNRRYELISISMYAPGSHFNALIKYGNNWQAYDSLGDLMPEEKKETIYELLALEIRQGYFPIILFYQEVENQLTRRLKVLKSSLENLKEKLENLAKALQELKNNFHST